MNDSLCKRTTASLSHWEALSHWGALSLSSVPPLQPSSLPKQSWWLYFLTNWLVTDPEVYLQANVPKKYYQTNQTDYIYLCGGRWRLAKQKPINVACIVAIVVPMVLYGVFEALWLWHHISGAIPVVFSYCWLLTLLFFLRLSLLDPGVLPNNIHVPRMAVNGTVTLPEEYGNIIKLPWVDATKGVNTKYCNTCNIWRPPRASHCGTCNACVINHDHHCVFLNNCVGRRNYRYFLYFLLLAVVTTSFLAITSFIHVFYYRIGDSDILTFKASISKYPVAFLLGIYALVAWMYPFLLLAFHLFLTGQNITTREYLNYVRGDHDPDFVNVYNQHGAFANWWYHWVANSRGVSAMSLTREVDEGMVGMVLRTTTDDDVHV